MKDLMKVMKRGNINFLYVPVEKLNRLTQQPSGAVATISPISFFDLESLLNPLLKTVKTIILDQISDARNLVPS
jgi:23S rRNA (guanosine2251-2'-O)-methyltransferase